MIHSSIDVKSWQQQLPSVEAVRPARCPACDAAGAPVGAPRGLHGHGVRSRLHLGPENRRSSPVAGEVTVRRYRCRHCRAVVMVLPRGVLRRLRYGVVAVALALALWAQGQASAEVQRQVSPYRIVSSEGSRGWRSVRRWAAGSAQLWPKLGLPPNSSGRGAAHETVRRLAALAPMPTGSLVQDACNGALYGNGHRECAVEAREPTT